MVDTTATSCEPVPQGLLDAFRAGRVVASIGAGFSAPCGFPTYLGLLQQVAGGLGLACLPDGCSDMGELDEEQMRLVREGGKGAFVRKFRHLKT